MSPFKALQKPLTQCGSFTDQLSEQFLGSTKQSNTYKTGWQFFRGGGLLGKQQSLKSHLPNICKPKSDSKHRITVLWRHTWGKDRRRKLKCPGEEERQAVKSRGKRTTLKPVKGYGTRWSTNWATLARARKAVFKKITLVHITLVFENYFKLKGLYFVLK